MASGMVPLKALLDNTLPIKIIKIKARKVGIMGKNSQQFLEIDKISNTSRNAATQWIIGQLSVFSWVPVGYYIVWI